MLLLHGLESMFSVRLSCGLRIRFECACPAQVLKNEKKNSLKEKKMIMLSF